MNTLRLTLLVPRHDVIVECRKATVQNDADDKWIPIQKNDRTCGKDKRTSSLFMPMHKFDSHTTVRNEIQRTFRATTFDRTFDTSRRRTIPETPHKNSLKTSVHDTIFPTRTGESLPHSRTRPLYHFLPTPQHPRPKYLGALEMNYRSPPSAVH